MSTNIKSVLDDIHSLVFNNFEYKTDLEKDGVLEKWTPPTTETTTSFIKAFTEGTTPVKLIGDCEDFAMLAREITRQVLPSADDRLVVCKDETGAGHCVLSVKGWIIDNRYREVKSNTELTRRGYDWLALSGKDYGDDWVKIKQEDN